MKWTSYTSGLVAEYLASLLLLFKGYLTKERRYKTSWGEIDLIVQRGRTLVFVEVKKRKHLVAGLEAITTKQRQRIEKAGQIYLSSVNIKINKIRFDVVIVTPHRLHHLKDAWRTV